MALYREDPNDYPCSYTYRSAFAEMFEGITLPPQEELEKEEEVSLYKPFQKPKYLSYQQWDEINRQKAQINHIEDKLNKHLKRKKEATPLQEERLHPSRPRKSKLWE